MSPELARAMSAAFDALTDDAGCRVVIVTGAGSVFCAGADLNVMAEGRGAELADIPGGFAGVVQRNFPKPIIAAVNGPALAGGFELVLGCDLVVASNTARFGIPEVKRALLAAAGGLVRLPTRIPRAIALELAVTGDPISADRAAELGLVNQVVAPDAVLDAALALAERITANSPLAVRKALEVSKTAPHLSEEEAFRLSLHAAIEVGQAPDAVEGARAFLEKRPPVWSE
jgi:enoyl-CoA hydratase